MIRQSDWIDEILKEGTSQKTWVVITSINYEERCLFTLREAVRRIPKSMMKRISFLPLTFAGGHLTSLLESLRQNYLSEAIEILKPLQERVGIGNNVYFPINYPPHESELTRKFENVVSQSDRQAGVSIVLDISCFPKTVLWRILEVLSSLADKPESPIVSFWGVYTWAKRYSEEIGAVGELRCHYAGNIEEYFSRIASSDEFLIVLPSHHGFEGKAAYEMLAGRPTTRYVFFMLNREDPLRSLKTLYSNQALLDSTEQHDTRIKYFYTLVDGMREVESVVHSQLTEDSSQLFLFAPFGPKPLSMYCFLVANRLRKNKTQADMISLGSYQYTSVYSYGVLYQSSVEIPLRILRGR